MTDQTGIRPPGMTARIEAVVQAAGDRLDESQRTLLREAAERLADVIATVHAAVLALHNADEPDPTFAAYRAED